MMKRIGTREEVFRGVAEKTSGGMRKQDIMIKNNKFISRKKSDRMKIMVAQNEKFQILNSNKKTQKRIIFHINKNKVQEYNCPNLRYYCGDDEDEDDEDDEDDEENNEDKNYRKINLNKKPREFKIEKIEDLNIDDLF